MKRQPALRGHCRRSFSERRVTFVPCANDCDGTKARGVAARYDRFPGASFCILTLHLRGRTIRSLQWWGPSYVPNLGWRDSLSEVIPCDKKLSGSSPVAYSPCLGCVQRLPLVKRRRDTRLSIPSQAAATVASRFPT